MGINLDDLRFKDATTLTIAGGVVTATQSVHIIAAQAGTADDLDTITAGHDDLTELGIDFRPLLWIVPDSGDTITLKHGTGNLALTGQVDITLDDDMYAVLYYDGTNWINLNLIAPPQTYATFVVGAQAGNVINVAIQLSDEAGADLAIRKSVLFYLADDANGDTPSATAPDGGIAIGTDGAMIEWTANLSGLLTSEADGDIDIDLTESGADTWYMVAVMPDGKLQVSAAITFV